MFWFQQPSDEPELLAVGTRVKAIFCLPQGGSDVYPGRIDLVNADGTYAIHYDDDDREGYPEGHEHHDAGTDERHHDYGAHFNLAP